jgi:hypothetical protein
MVNMLGNLNNAEKEILILKAVWESIHSMLNYQVVNLNHNDPNSQIGFKSSIHKKFFNIILVDFLNATIFGIGKTCLDALKDVSENPQFNLEVTSLQNATRNFDKWLNQEIELKNKHDGEKRDFWFPTINQAICLKITRKEFIEVCGNISKHNPFVLNRVANKIITIFSRNAVTIDISEALLLMGEFYEQFHDDLFSYHCSTIAEFLNNLRWSIFEYLQPLYNQFLEDYMHEKFKERKYPYNIPINLKIPYAREIFWNLMNDVRSEPYMPKFEVTPHLKGMY